MVEIIYNYDGFTATSSNGGLDLREFPITKDTLQEYLDLVAAARTAGRVAMQQPQPEAVALPRDPVLQLGQA